MWIDVKIPYEPDNRLAEAYNRAMLNTSAKWVLLLDHDVFLACNPYWYDVCLKAISQVDDSKVGLLTCMTGGPQKRLAQKTHSIINNDIDYHISIAKETYANFGTCLQDINWPITGFFMLVNRKAWKEVPFQDQGKGVNKIDQMFCEDLLKVGWHINIMKGLYVYHKRGVRRKVWQETII